MSEVLDLFLELAAIPSPPGEERAVADVVIALPQWSTSEYRAGFLSQQLAWRDEMFAAGTDHAIGADFHWAGALSITPGGVSGNHLAVASAGNGSKRPSVTTSKRAPNSARLI